MRAKPSHMCAPLTREDRAAAVALGERRAEQLDHLVALRERQHHHRADGDHPVVDPDQVGAAQRGQAQRHALGGAAAVVGPGDRRDRREAVVAHRIGLRDRRVAEQPLELAVVRRAPEQGAELVRLDPAGEVRLLGRELGGRRAGERRALLRARPVNISARASCQATCARVAGSCTASYALRSRAAPAGPFVSTSACASASSTAVARSGGGGSSSARRRYAAALSAAPFAIAARRGLLEQLGGPGGAAARRGEQLGGDVLGVGARIAQRQRGALVRQLALARRELVVDGVADERVHERERRLGTEDLRAHERARRAGDGRLVELGERGDDGQRRALAEHAHRPGDGGGSGGEPGEAEQDGAGDGARADGAHRRRRGRRRGARPRPRACAGAGAGAAGCRPWRRGRRGRTPGRRRRRAPPARAP